MRKIIISCFLFLLTLSCSSKKNKLPTIGIFQINSIELADAAREGFIKGLKDGGYEDGININLDLQNAQGDITTLQLIAQKFVSDKVNIITAITTPSLQAALNATDNIPIVFSAIANPYKAGAGKSSTEHRANVTGASATAPITQTLELIKKENPEIQKVGVIWNPSYANSLVDVTLCRETCKNLNLTLEEVNVTSSSEVYQAAQTLAGKNIDIFFTVFDHSVLSALESLIKVADQNEIPIISNDPKTIERGITMGLGWDYFENGVESAKLALRILNGENPKDIPFQGLKKITLGINLKKAQLTNTNFSDEVINNANKLIQ